MPDVGVVRCRLAAFPFLPLILRSLPSCLEDRALLPQLHLPKKHCYSPDRLVVVEGLNLTK